MTTLRSLRVVIDVQTNKSGRNVELVLEEDEGVTQFAMRVSDAIDRIVDEETQA